MPSPRRPTGAAPYKPTYAWKPRWPRFKRTADLQLGATPFDDLSREDLIRLLCAHHVALSHTVSTLKMIKANEEERMGGLGPFWIGPQGYARRAMEKGEYLLRLVGGTGERARRIHESAMRYVRHLLFPREADVSEIMTCDRCGVFVQNLFGGDGTGCVHLRKGGPGGRDCPVKKPLTWELLRDGGRFVKAAQD